MYRNVPKRRHPGSARLPTAFFSINSRNSSILSGLISASTTTAKGLAVRAVVVDLAADVGAILEPMEWWSGKKERTSVGRSEERSTWRKEIFILSN